jgi:hypothetical protein
VKPQNEALQQTRSALTSTAAALAAERRCSADTSRARTALCWLVTGLVVLFLLVPTGASAEDRQRDYLTVEVRQVSDPGAGLEFTVRSKLDQAFTMYEADLPWGNANSVELSFETVSGKQACPLYTRAIDDPPDTRVEVAPGHSLKGVVHLAASCPAIDDVLAQSNVVVKWHYRPVHGGSYSRTDHGEITLKKTSR